MNLIKGMLIGGAIAAGAYMLCSENFEPDRRKMMKTSRQVLKKMGIV